MSLFSKPQIYTVHINPAQEHAMEKALFVREGFNFAGFFFGILWALYMRMWRVAGLIFLVVTILAIAEDLKLVDNVTLAILQVAFSVIVGFQANDWRRSTLARSGYIMSDVVVSDNKLRAQQRYFDRVLAA